MICCPKVNITCGLSSSQLHRVTVHLMVSLSIVIFYRLISKNFSYIFDEELVKTLEENEGRGVRALLYQSALFDFGYDNLCLQYIKPIFCQYFVRFLTCGGGKVTVGAVSLHTCVKVGFTPNVKNLVQCFHSLRKL